MPRADPADSFSYSELASAAGIGKPTYQHLHRSGLLPGGQGIRDLKRLATIGAFVAGGVPIFAAAGIAKAILWSFNQNDGEAPSGLNDLVRRSPPALAFLTSVQIEELNDYWLHRALFEQGIKAGDTYQHSDVRAQVVDRRYVFLSFPLMKEAELVGWLEDWRRGSEPRLVHIAEKESDVESEPFIRLTGEAEKARQNAIGILTVNLSLAIRRALDRLAEHRRRN